MNRSDKKNILIISYFFPPCNKVGGRRWAKFGKYLHRKKHNIYVLSVSTPYNGSCPWEKDLHEFRSNISRLHYIEHQPFHVLNKTPQTITGKIKYRLSWYKTKIFKGNATDISEKYRNNLLEQAEKIIVRNNIETVIITGGPFHWCNHAIQLKKKFPGIRFLLDLRDYWTGGEAYKKLSPENKSKEDKMELECVSLSDNVFTPAERIAGFLKQKYEEHRNKIIVLPHAFDAEEIPVETSENVSDSKTISFAYGGILYSNMQQAVNRMIELLKHLKLKGFNVKVDIYTFDHSYSELFSNAGLNNVVNYHPTIPPEQLFRTFKSTDYLLQLRAGETEEQHFKSTKFYELIALKKPIVYFGPEGDVSSFITENKLGFSGNTPINELTEAIIKNKSDDRIPDVTFNVSQFEYKHITDTLENYL